MAKIKKTFRALEAEFRMLTRPSKEQTIKSTIFCITASILISLIITLDTTLVSILVKQIMNLF